jgi:hypothetical protein
MCVDESNLHIRASSLKDGPGPRRVVRADVRARPGHIQVDVASVSTAPPPPPELFLRELLALDVGQVGPIARFLNDFGFLYADADSPLVGWRAATRNALVTDPRVGSPDWYTYFLACLRRRRDEKLQNRDEVLRDSLQIVPSAFETDGARLLLLQVRDMTRIWLMGWGFMSLEVVRRDWESSHWCEGGPPTIDDCAAFLSTTVSAGLAPFHPRVLVDGEEEPPVDLYAALCFQLYGAILENQPPRKCKREACQGFFIHQRGRAKWRPHKASQYCDKRCALRDADDRRRANVRTARRLKQEGLSDSRIAREMHANIETVRSWLRAAAKRSRRDAL